MKLLTLAILATLTILSTATDDSSKEETSSDSKGKRGLVNDSVTLSANSPLIVTKPPVSHYGNPANIQGYGGYGGYNPNNLGLPDLGQLTSGYVGAFDTNFLNPQTAFQSFFGSQQGQGNEGISSFGNLLGHQNNIAVQGSHQQPSYSIQGNQQPSYSVQGNQYNRFVNPLVNQVGYQGGIGAPMQVFGQNSYQAAVPRVPKMVMAPSVTRPVVHRAVVRPMGFRTIRSFMPRPRPVRTIPAFMPVQAMQTQAIPAASSQYPVPAVPVNNAYQRFVPNYSSHTVVRIPHAIQSSPNYNTNSIQYSSQPYGAYDTVAAVPLGAKISVEQSLAFPAGSADESEFIITRGDNGEDYTIDHDDS